MRSNKQFLRLILFSFCLPLMVGCGLFDRSRGDVEQEVAFPQMAESPPTTEASLPKPVVHAPTAAPTATPTSVPPTEIPPTAVPLTNQTTATATAAVPQVLSFTAEAVDTNPGKTITFSWQSSGGTSARIYNGAEGYTQEPIFWDVPPSGTYTVFIPETRRSNPAFELFIYGDEELTTYDTALVDVAWPCTNPYFFDSIPAICPEPAVYTTAVEQRFQGGRMILLQELDWIYVLYDEVAVYGGPGGVGNLQWERHQDQWTGAVADVDLATVPPAGFFAPTGSLGFLWRENEEVREKLGWALAPEVSFEGAWQWQFSETATRPGSIDVFIQLQDGFAARLTGFEDEWGWVWITFGPFS